MTAIEELRDLVDTYNHMRHPPIRFIQLMGLRDASQEFTDAAWSLFKRTKNYLSQEEIREEMLRIKLPPNEQTVQTESTPKLCNQTLADPLVTASLNTLRKLCEKFKESGNCPVDEIFAIQLHDSLKGKGVDMTEFQDEITEMKLYQ